MKKILSKCCAAIVLFLLICVACSSKKDAGISQLLFNESLTNAYLDGDAYTGKAWSEDGRTICLTCEGGKVALVEVYHPNGQVAMRNTSLVGGGDCFDLQGNPISVEEFVAGYPAIVVHIQRMVENMLCSSELP